MNVPLLLKAFRRTARSLQSIGYSRWALLTLLEQALDEPPEAPKVEPFESGRFPLGRY